MLATATGQGASGREMVGLMGAAATDHLFLDGGHTIDFTNKAFEVLEHLGWGQAGEVLPLWPTKRPGPVGQRRPANGAIPTISR